MVNKLLCWMALIAAGSAQAALPTYAVKELFSDSLRDTGIYSRATVIANTGWVGAERGYVGGGGVAYRCLLSSACEQVPFPPGGHHGTVVPSGIGKDGVMVGSGPIDSQRSRGFKWDGVTLTFFEPFTDECPWCYLSTGASAIDRNGVVAGKADGKDERGLVSYAVTFDVEGKPSKLPDLGGQWSRATGITNGGIVVGTALRPDGLSRGWVYDGAQLIELGTLGGSGSEARGVNEHGLVIGCSLLPGDSNVQGFVYEEGVMTAIPFLAAGSACPNAINRHGRIVGFDHKDGNAVGTLIVRGKAIDLNERLVDDDRANWSIVNAEGINGKGEIAATAIHRTAGVQRAVVLIPVGP